MRLISSRLTFFLKRVFPTVWFGFLALCAVIPVAYMSARKDFRFEFLMLSAVAAGGVMVSYVIMKKQFFDLVDEVWDAGTELVVKNGETEEHIPLAEIMNVSHAIFTNPERVTLSLRHPTLLGKEIAFIPPSQFLPFSRSPVVDDLIQRIDAAHRSNRPPDET